MKVKSCSRGSRVHCFDPFVNTIQTDLHTAPTMPPAIRKYSCTICNKRFTKAEHLQRHGRSHTGAKPFSCEKCSQAFSRLDSLNRHKQRRGFCGSSHEQQSVPEAETRLAVSDDARDPNDLPGEDQSLSIPSPPLDISLSDPPNTHISPRDSSHGAAMSDPENLDNGFMNLTWPDSEALLQSILNTNLSSWPQNIEAVPSQFVFKIPDQASIPVASPWLSNDATEGLVSGANAVRSISQMISNVSSNLASEAQFAVLSTVFLEACLHAFFEYMTPVFPICHRSTFVFQDWTHPLLLNAIALGSLFMGQDVDIARGEVLWTLAHTAVATSWHSLIEHRGPHDVCNGVQLITTALLGQNFAMLSSTSKLRSTAQIFHSLGFYWARQCGMYHSRKSSFLIELANSPSNDERLKIWRRWAASEVQLRALLGHYVLDGQLTQFTAAPTCQRHTSNPLPFPSSDRLFFSSSLQEWMDVMQREQPVQRTFRDFFLVLFDGPASTLFQDSQISLLAFQVTLECLQSLITDHNCAGCLTVGSPSLDAIEKVLSSMWHPITNAIYIRSGDKLQLLLRWHAVNIDKAINFNRLCKTLLTSLDIQQTVFSVNNVESSIVVLSTWARSRSAREALLHASEIRRIICDLPIRAVHAIHIPITVFAAATVYIAFIIGGVSSMKLPAVVDWKIVTGYDLHAGDDDTEIESYLSNAGMDTNVDQARNLLYDVNSFVLLIKQLRRPWTICDDLDAILHQMCARLGA